MTNFGFDVSNTKPSAAFDPLPPGWYAMRIAAAEVVTPKSGGRDMLRVQFEIIEQAHPEFAGRKVFTNFNHLHDNKQTREIAQSQIAAICQAIGKPNATTVEQMLGGELLVKLTAKPAENGYDARNETRGFKALTDVQAQAAPKPMAAAGAASPPKQPWKTGGAR